MLIAVAQGWGSIITKVKKYFIVLGVFMWIADKWTDYELLDSSDGERL